MPIFGLADCNNFYVSCEHVFQPDLARRPVIVLSNNDGCVVARSPEAKRLGIAMGVPLFQVRSIVERHDVEVMSSNYALYGDLSERVMSLFAAAAPRIEVYSIDECFLDLDRLAIPDLGSWLRDLRSKVHRWTGIPVSIGTGPTKTLAKLANRLAKSSPRTDGVLDLANNPAWIEPALSRTAVGDIWGIGPRRAKMLGEAGLRTALDLRAAPDGWVRKRMGIVGLRIVHELRGIACHALETQPPAKQSTCVSRTFARAVRDPGEVRDAIASFAERAAAKLRAARQVCGALQVFVATDRFDPTAARHSASGSAGFTTPTADSRPIAAAASRIFEDIRREGVVYRKAGVLLLDLSPEDSVAPTLFPETPDDRLMPAVDAINKRHGRGAIGLGLAATGAAWRMRQLYRSPRFTTRWQELATARLETSIGGQSNAAQLDAQPETSLSDPCEHGRA